jgi:outer membrane receptor protein involved in Fe transport
MITTRRFAGPSAAISTALLVTILVSASVFAQQGLQGSIAGTVKDPEGASVSGAEVMLLHPQQAVLGTTVTDASGHFKFDNVPAGAYEVRITQAGFGVQRASAHVSPGKTTELEIILEVAPVSSQVTVTAETGQAQDKDRVPQAVNIISESAIQQRATAVLAQVANEEVGLSLQRTSPTIAGIFVRGLVGNKVAVYVDGVRYTTSAMRGGINTFLDLNDPSNLRAVEILRGPNGAQYGSDSIGGTVQLVSRTPEFGYATPETHGEIKTFFSSADLSFGGNTLLTYGTRRFGFLLNASGHRVNTLRPGHGLDPHAAVTRFLGLPSNIFGNRLTDTAFTQYGGLFRLSFAPDSSQQFIFHYYRGQQDGGKRYDQTLGGDGNLIADLRNLMNDFFYGRYLKQGVGPFDNLSLTLSYNAQREERVNQGGQGNPNGDITHQYERTQVFGINAFVDKQLTQRNTLLLGTDFYRETVISPAFTVNPVTNRSTLSRPRIPDGAHYELGGFYVQDVFEAIPNKLRLSGALRYNIASYLSSAANSPVVGGQRLWPDDSLRVKDFSGRVGLVLTPARPVSIAFNYSRGFRAPNITDLGTLGLTGDGFEADFFSAAALGGTIGTTAGNDAVSSGIAVQRQRSEVSNNFDLGVRIRHKRFDTDLTWFLTDINGAIVKQALILPPGAVGRFLGDQQIDFQDPTRGWVTVPLSTAPVLIRANFTDARLYGLEYTLDARLSHDWTFGGNFTYVHAKDKANDLPPNIEGGTPAPTGFLRLRYEPAGKNFWVEGYSTLADRQSRLSSLDLSDRRTGATRSRGQIANFFRRGACVRGLVAPGPDGRCATGNETILIPTGETLAQVQNRVLGTATSAPLFTYIPGYGLINMRGGYRFEKSEVSIDFENITDHNYRGLAWGIEGPGRSVTARYRYRF